METINGMSTRSKIYNKMVQMLECKGVRDTIGCHWKDWVSQQDTRLARARDEARQRGLTRAKVTFYCQNDIPSDEIMEATLRRIIQYVDASLVYTTPYAYVWNAYCDSLLHSLVVVDRTQNVVLIVYSYNELTQNISGQYISKWSEKDMWSLANLTLNGNLLIDLIEILHISKTGKGNNADLVEKAGLQSHASCSPYIAHVQANLKSKIRAEFKMAQELDIVLPHVQKLQNKETSLKDAATQITEDRQSIELELEEKREQLKTLDKCTEHYSNTKLVPLSSLKQGMYVIKALKECTRQYGDTFIMLLEKDGSLKKCYSIKYLDGRIREYQQNEPDITHPQRGFIALYDKPLATLTIKGWGQTKQHHVIVNCSLSWTITSRNDSLNMQ